VRPAADLSLLNQVDAIGASLVAAQQLLAAVGPPLAPDGCARPGARRQGIRNAWDAAGPLVGGNAAGIDPNLGKS